MLLATMLETMKPCPSKVIPLSVRVARCLNVCGFRRVRQHAHYGSELHPKVQRQFLNHPIRQSSPRPLSACVHYFLQTDLLNQWTGYLVAEALIPANQLSTDDFAGALANQTNLAIKGVIGIQAMSVISGMLGDTTNQQNYSVCDCCSSALTWTHPSNIQSIVQRYVPQILNYATSNDGLHLTLNYGNESS